MLEVGDAIYAILSGATAVTALAGTNIYPDLSDELIGNATFIVYKKISNTPVHSMTGGSSLASARVQVDCYATTRAAAKALAKVVYDTLDSYRNTVASIWVQSCLCVGQHDFVVSSVGNENLRSFGWSFDFEIYHQI